MSKLHASIFNDVIGPIMRGPSSSHVAGAARIGALIRQAQQADIEKVQVYFDPNGSLAESYDGHGSDIGFVSGLLGMELTDANVPNALKIAKDQGLDIQFIIESYGAEHPNNYRIAVQGKNASHTYDAISVGGGMVEMEVFDGFSVSVEGGYFEYFLVFENKNHAEKAQKTVQSLGLELEEMDLIEAEHGALLSIKLAFALPKDQEEILRSQEGLKDFVLLNPILPTRAKANCTLPFLNAEELLEYAKDKDVEFWELACLYESIRGNSTPEAVFEQMSKLVAVMEDCIANGLAGTEYDDRILGPQAYKIDEAKAKNLLIPGDLHNRIITYITSIMEVKSAMGVIVAAPTAGSCGGLPGTLIGTARSLELERDTLVKGMLSAGLIGAFIAEAATFAAEVAGCQVECGAGSGMAAAGLATMMGGTVEQCVDAASQALQNITGLACDPVANRVEVPCLGKNIMCGLNAVASANMILAGFDKVVPLDQTIAAIYDIGLKLPLELRCTWGGLGKSAASMTIREKLDGK